MAGFAAWLEEEGITFYRSVPVVFRQLMASLTRSETFPGAPPGPRGWGCRRGARRGPLQASTCPTIVCSWPATGSTETGIVLQHFMDKTTPVGERGVSLGYPVDEARVVVLDDDGAEVADGEVGELVIESRYLALGYWREPALTQAVFDDGRGAGDPRTYHTGDMGRRLPDGCVEHRGRKAWHAKVRGYRVDPGEIEHALRAMPAVADVVVVPWHEPAGDTRLVAYLVAPGQPPTAGDVRAFLQARLPAYMVPASFVMLDALPRTPTGKVDRHALPSPIPARPAAPAPFAVPRTPVEVRLATLWSAVLGLDRVGHARRVSRPRR